MWNTLYLLPLYCSHPSPWQIPEVPQRVLPQAVRRVLWLEVRLGLLWVLVWAGRLVTLPQDQSRRMLSLRTGMLAQPATPAAQRRRNRQVIRLAPPQSSKPTAEGVPVRRCV
jgi:hypothetical protein